MAAKGELIAGVFPIMVVKNRGESASVAVSTTWNLRSFIAIYMHYPGETQHRS
jgi:hypothetical protein